MMFSLSFRFYVNFYSFLKNQVGFIFHFDANFIPDKYAAVVSKFIRRDLPILLFHIDSFHGFSVYKIDGPPFLKD